MTEAEATAAVASLVGRLPPLAQRALSAITLEVQEGLPDAEDMALGIPGDTAGVYVDAAMPQTDEDKDEAEERTPAGIVVLFLGNIKPCDAAGVQAIFLHEAAHALGLNETDVEGMGL